ncbi:hypothetical protein HA402_004935 [Bradysia odoriphaga]|nr:hypothetical protein HA402_004935 [Bradysia odoriphaga]
MMPKSEFVVFLMINVLSAYGSFHNIPAGHPDHPGKCWFEEKQIEMNDGDKITSTKFPCVQYVCRKNDMGLDFTYLGYESDYGFYFHRPSCSEFMPYCGYRVQEGDLTKPYPDCCPTAVEDKTQICRKPIND